MNAFTHSEKNSALNQTQVTAILNIAQITYSDYEKGKVRMRVELLIQLARYYNVDMNFICGISNSKSFFPEQSEN